MVSDLLSQHSRDVQAGRVAPVAQPPELFTGFRASIETERQRGIVSQQRLTGLYEQRQTLLKQLATTPLVATRPALPIAFTAIPVLGPITNAVLQLGVADPIAKLLGAPESPETNKLKAELAAIDADITLQTELIREARWRTGVAISLPNLIATGAVTNTAEAITMLSGGNTSDDDVKYITSLITNLSESTNYVIEKAAGKPLTIAQAQAILSEYQQQRGNFSTFFSVDPNRQTVEEVINTLKLAGRFQPPPGVTPGQVLEAMRLLGMADNPVAQDIIDARSQAIELAKSVQASDIKFKLMQADATRYALPQIYAAIDKQRWANAIAQPALVFMQPFEYWYEHITRPITGIAVSGGLLLGDLFLPGSERDKFMQPYRQARADGATAWEAWRITEEQWDTNGILKFTSEVLLDPLSYLGFGIVGKALGKLPFIGRVLQIANDGYARGMQWPFDQARKAWLATVPRTVSQHARDYAAAGVADIIRFLTHEAYPNKGALEFISAAEARDALVATIVNAVAQPQAIDTGTKVGRYLLGKQEISASNIADLASSLNVKVDITTARLEVINSILELTDGTGISKFLRPNEAAAPLLAALDLMPTPENLAETIKWISKAQRSIVNRAINNIAGENVTDLLVNIAKDMQDNFITARQTEIATSRLNTSLLSAGLTKLDATTKLIFIEWLDKWVTTPFARAYLTTLFYGPMNVVENAYKSAASGVNPFFITDELGRSFPVHFAGIEDELPLDILKQSKFILGLGPVPDNALAQLSGSVVLTAEQRSAAQLSVGNWVENLMQARWLNFKGYNLERISLMEWGAKLGGKQRTHYWNANYNRLLAERNPEVLDAMQHIAEQVLPLDQLTKYMEPKVAKAAQQWIYDALLTGNTNIVKSFSQHFTPGHVAAQELDNILSNYVELISPEITDWLKTKAINGEMFAGGTASVDRIVNGQLRELLTDRYLSSLKLYNDRFAEFVNDQIGITATNISELNLQMNTVDQAIQTYRETAHNALEAAQLFARRLHNPIEKDAYWLDFYTTRYNPVVNTTGQQIENMITAMRDKLQVADIVKTMTVEERERYLQLLDREINNVAVMRNAHASRNDLRQQYFEPNGARYKAPGRTRDNKFWNEFFDDIDNLMDNTADQLLDIHNQAIDLGSRISGLHSPIPVDVSQRGLLPIDVANLFGTNPADLQRAMYVPEMVAIRGKREFIKLVKGRVELGAKAIGKTPEQLGWTDSALERVYLTVMRELESSPGVVEALSPMLVQLNSIRQEVIKLGQRSNSLMSDDALRYINGRLSTVRLPETRETILLRSPAEVLAEQEGELLLHPLTNTEQQALEDIIQHHVELNVRDTIDLAARNNLVLSEERLAAARAGEETKWRSIYGKPSKDFDPNLKGIPEGTEQEWEQRLATLADESVIPLTRFRSQDISERIDAAIARTDLNEAELSDLAAEAIDLTNTLAGEGYSSDLINFIKDYATGLQEAAPAAGVLPSVLRSEARSLSGWVAEVQDEFPLREAIVTWFHDVNNTALQRLGKLASNSQQYKDSIQQLLKQRYPSGYIRIYRGSGRAKSEGLDPLEREYTNVTASREVALDFQSANDAWTVEAKLQKGLSPEIDSVIIRVEDVVSIASAKESELIIPSAVLRERIATPLTVPGITRTAIRPGEIIPSTLDDITAGRGNPDDFKQLLHTFSTTWQDERRTIAQEVRQQFNQDFPNYDDSTAFTSMMKVLYPFVSYEAHRWAWWLPREALRHPGTFLTLGKYQDNTDTGYIHIPGTSLDFNPLRGTIFMGGMRRLFTRDYPEYYDSFQGLAEVTDYLSRFGFYPGAPYGLFMSAFGGQSPQYGEVLPAWQRTVLNTIIAAVPESKAAKWLQDVVFPDRFRDFLKAREASNLGAEGIRILEKHIKKEALLPEEQTAWDKASRGVAGFGILAEQSSMLRFNPEDRIKVFAAANQLLSELTGLPVEQIRDLQRQGLRLEDVIGPLTPDIQRALMALQGWSKYTGGSVVLQPSQLGQVMLLQREFWQRIADNTLHTKQRLELDEQRLTDGTASLDQWLNELSNVMQARVQFIDELKATPRYVNTPMTLDERRAFAEKWGTLEPVFHALEELRQLYFAKQLEEVYNYDTNTYEPDWDGLFFYRDMLEQSLPDDVKEQLIDELRHNDTPLQRTYYDISKQYLRPYNQVADALLQQFIPAERKVILRHRRADTAESQELQAVISTTFPDRQLISVYTEKLRIIHENMRDTDPELDAWLNLFRRVKSFRTPEAEQRFMLIKQQLRIQ